MIERERKFLADLKRSIGAAVKNGKLPKLNCILCGDTGMALVIDGDTLSDKEVSCPLCNSHT